MVSRSRSLSKIDRGDPYCKFVSHQFSTRCNIWLSGAGVGRSSVADADDSEGADKVQNFEFASEVAAIALQVESLDLATTCSPTFWTALYHFPNSFSFSSAFFALSSASVSLDDPASVEEAQRPRFQSSTSSSRLQQSSGLLPSPMIRRQMPEKKPVGDRGALTCTWR